MYKCTKGKAIEPLKHYVICFELELSGILIVFLLLITDSTNTSVPIVMGTKRLVTYGSTGTFTEH